AAAILRDLGTPCLIHQPSYSMFNRWTEDDGLYDALADVGMGSIVFSPLAQGMLTNKYLKGIPGDSRAAKPHGFLKKEALTEGKLAQISQLNELASARGQTLAQMAIAWVLRQPQITSALIGASRLAQVQDCVGALDSLDFTTEELARIDAICGQ
ncbi:MAG: L-glyceraldehyde 3-phosphate reductase, partial [Victivallales bacterium]|nr:L-glyceraldehyde 3-phosphate reductase [Victivallales bacterium]